MKKLAFSALFVGLVACGGGDKKPPMVIDAPPTGEDSGGGNLECDPLAQTGCASGEKCGWVRLQAMPFVGTIACVPDGTVAQGQTCMYNPEGATGYSNCEGGTECVGGICKALCNPDATMAPMCDAATSACSRYNNLFEVSDETLAGVCDVKCDPLTQEAVVDAPTKPACGSMDPAAPDVGCYTSDFVDFTCARIPMEAKGRTDYMAAYGPGGDATTTTGAFVNGCEAGYVPMFAEGTGSTKVVCTGLCAPAATSTATAMNADGDRMALGKLHNVAMARVGDATCQAGKKGATAGSECWYAWFFNVENGMVPDSPYMNGLGVCFQPAKYNYDHDQDPATANLNFPACASLPPPGAPPANCTCDPMTGCTGMGCPQGLADEWGCQPLPEEMPKTGKVANKSGVRVGRGEVKVYRHALQ